MGDHQPSDTMKKTSERKRDVYARRARTRHTAQVEKKLCKCNGMAKDNCENGMCGLWRRRTATESQNVQKKNGEQRNKQNNKELWKVNFFYSFVHFVLSLSPSSRCAECRLHFCPAAEIIIETTTNERTETQTEIRYDFKQI